MSQDKYNDINHKTYITHVLVYIKRSMVMIKMAGDSQDNQLNVTHIRLILSYKTVTSVICDQYKSTYFKIWSLLIFQIPMN